MDYLYIIVYFCETILYKIDVMGLIIKEVLEKQGVSIAKLVQIMSDKGYSLSRVAISNIINEKSSPKVSTLEEIADSLDMQVVDFFRGSEDGATPIYSRNDDGTFSKIGSLI